MSSRARFLWGGIGALAPIVVNLLVVDMVVVFRELQPIVIAGYTFKAVLLFATGGVWAYLHRTELEPLKVFQLGIVAPAVFLSVNNGLNLRGRLSQPEGASRPVSAAVLGALSSPAAGHASTVLWVATAYAPPALTVRSGSRSVAESTMTVRGVVVDSSTGRPLQGAQVLVGSALGTLTNAGGQFEVIAPRRDVQLVVRHIGYRILRRTVTPSIGIVAPLRLLLAPSDVTIEAVVVTATAPPKSSVVAQFIDGLLSRPRTDRRWYVLGENFNDLAAARTRAQELTVLSGGQAEAKVYVTDSTAGGKRYAVGWDGNLSYTEAQRAAMRISNLSIDVNPRVVRVP